MSEAGDVQATWDRAHRLRAQSPTVRSQGGDDAPRAMSLLVA
jgi:hypothetical protein